jgi:hypothetical protein
MKEELITFETAKLAKEKGFTRGKYNFDFYKPDGNVLHMIDFSSEFVKFCIPYSTQSLLQKWLREVHGINIFMTFKPNIKKWDFIPYFMSMDGKEYIKYNSEYTKIYNERRFDTYEEALETGLQEALKLIEIVKEK